MPSKRPPAVQEKAYVEIDLKELRENGAVVIIGDPIIAPMITTRVPKGNFEIVYTADLFDVVEKLGNQKMQVLKYLLENKNGYNEINASNSELAKLVGCSRPTVIETLKIMSDAGLVKRKGSVISISPHLMIKGNRMREAYLMRKYEEISDNAYEIESNAIDVDLDPQLSFIGDKELQIVQKAKNRR